MTILCPIVRLVQYKNCTQYNGQPVVQPGDRKKTKVIFRVHYGGPTEEEILLPPFLVEPHIEEFYFLGVFQQTDSGIYVCPIIDAYHILFFNDFR